MLPKVLPGDSYLSDCNSFVAHYCRLLEFTIGHYTSSNFQLLYLPPQPTYVPLFFNQFYNVSMLLLAILNEVFISLLDPMTLIVIN